MVKTVSPKAQATPRKPMPVLGKPAASTAAPQPPKTSQNVPINSAIERVPKDIIVILLRQASPELRQGVAWNCISRLGAWSIGNAATSCDIWNAARIKRPRAGDGDRSGAAAS